MASHGEGLPVRAESLPDREIGRMQHPPLTTHRVIQVDGVVESPDPYPPSVRTVIFVLPVGPGHDGPRGVPQLGYARVPPSSCDGYGPPTGDYSGVLLFRRIELHEATTVGGE